VREYLFEEKKMEILTAGLNWDLLEDLHEQLVAYFFRVLKVDRLTRRQLLTAVDVTLLSQSFQSLCDVPETEEDEIPNFESFVDSLFRVLEATEQENLESFLAIKWVPGIVESLKQYFSARRSWKTSMIVASSWLHCF
jgi:hypothetical protein